MSEAAQLPKRRLDDLALLGGPKLFARPRPIGQLAAPDLAELLTLLHPLRRRGAWGTQGSHVAALERELGEYHGVPHVVAVANAALGLTMLMRALARGRAGEVLMPAFTFRGLLHFAKWAGQRPALCDVDPRSHAMCPQALRAAINADTTCILAVGNVNAPGDLDALEAVAAATDLPLLIDSVYSIGSSWRGRRVGGFGCAEVFSLHATKLLHGFEGGYVCTRDPELAALLRWMRDLDSEGAPPPGWPGALRLDARLNEIHAATGRLALRNLPATIARNRQRHELWEAALAGLSGLSLLGYPRDEESNYQAAILAVDAPWPLSRDQTLALLQAEGMAIVSYYAPALHLSSHWHSPCALPPLPVAESLAQRFLRLPVGELLGEQDIAAVAQLLHLVQEQGQALSARLGALR